MEEHTEHNAEQPKAEEAKAVHHEPHKPHEHHKDRTKFSFRDIYEKQYKKLLIIPFLLLFLAVLSIAFKVGTTGDFINRDVSLKGGLTLTVPLDEEIDILALEKYLDSEFSSNDVSVRALKQAGVFSGIVIDADIGQESIDSLVSSVGSSLGMTLNEGDYSIEIMGSALGTSFFKETLRSLLIAFLFMGCVVFVYFRVPVPSLAVILCAFTDIVITLAIVNLLGIKISTAGIAAFLMLIGYSVDTDILLSTRVLKRKNGTVMERIMGAMQTGLMMTATTICAVIVAIIFTQSDVIRQIMIILLVGLIVDVINTWIQNVGILRIYLEKQHKHD